MFISASKSLGRSSRICAGFLLCALPSLRAADEPASAPQTGDATITLTDRSPNSNPTEMAKRLGLKSDDVGDDYKLDGKKLNAYVPADYIAASPVGLLVFRGSGDRPAAALKPVFDQAHLIFVAMNGGDSWRDAGTLLDLVHNLSNQYSLDPRRIYLMEDEDAHFSTYAVIDVYTGVISFTKVVYPGMLKYTMGSQYWTVYPHDQHVPEASLVKTARQRAWVLLLPPDSSPNDLQFMTASGMSANGFAHLKTLKVANEDKQYPNLKPDWLKTAIAYLDAAAAKSKTGVATTTPALANRAATTAPVAATATPANRSRQMLSLAKSYMDAGRVDLAKAKLNDLIAQYPNEPAAGEARKMLERLGN